MVSPDVEQYGLKPETLIAVSSIFIIFTTLAIGLRLYVRVFMIKFFGRDDAMLLFAYVSRFCRIAWQSAVLD